MNEAQILEQLKAINEAYKELMKLKNELVIKLVLMQRRNFWGSK